MSSESDDEIVQRLRAGDRSAFAELCRRYWSLVGRYFATKLEEHHIDDQRQQTFERLQTALERYEGRGSLRAFVLGIAHNVMLEFMRSRYREAKEDIDDLSVADVGLRPSSLLARRDDQRRVLHALRRIPMIFQVVLELTYWEHMSDREVGDVLGMPANTVRSRRSRAKDRLREELARAPDDAPEEPPVLTETPADFEAWAQRIGREIWDGADPQLPK